MKKKRRPYITLKHTSRTERKVQIPFFTVSRADRTIVVDRYGLPGYRSFYAEFGYLRRCGVLSTVGKSLKQRPPSHPHLELISATKKTSSSRHSSSRIFGEKIYAVSQDCCKKAVQELPDVISAVLLPTAVLLDRSKTPLLRQPATLSSSSSSFSQFSSVSSSSSPPLYPSLILSSQPLRSFQVTSIGLPSTKLSTYLNKTLPRPFNRCSKPNTFNNHHLNNTSSQLRRTLEFRPFHTTSLKRKAQDEADNRTGAEAEVAVGEDFDTSSNTLRNRSQNTFHPPRSTTMATTATNGGAETSTTITNTKEAGSSYSAKFKLPSHFHGGNSLESAPPSAVKDFVAAHDGHTVITKASPRVLSTSKDLAT